MTSKLMLTDNCRRYRLLYNYWLTNYLMTDPSGNQLILYPQISIFPLALPQETLRFLRNKINCFPWDQSCVNCYIFSKIWISRMTTEVYTPIHAKTSQYWIIKLHAVGSRKELLAVMKYFWKEKEKLWKSKLQIVWTWW